MWSSSPSRTGPAMLRGRKSSRRCPAFGRCARARIARRSPWPLCTAPCPRCSGCSSGAAPSSRCSPPTTPRSRTCSCRSPAGSCAMRDHPLVQLTLARMREFYREPEAIFWVFGFPLVLAFALGIAFRNRGPGELKVGVLRAPGDSAIATALDRAPALAATVLDSSDARIALRTGRIALLVVPGEPLVYRYDSTRTESRLARLEADAALQRARGRADAASVRDERITEPGARYIDFLIPGLLGMNLMGSGLWGVGFSVVQARTKKLLKRLMATPMRRGHYLLSFILSRLLFLFLEIAALVGFGWVMFGVGVRGSYGALALITVLGALSFAGLGMLVASRARTIEAVSGLMNLVMLPMWILSGTFFSYARFPDAMQPFVKALPLTALNDALRAVMIDGTGVLRLRPPPPPVSGGGGVGAGGAVGNFPSRQAGPPPPPPPPPSSLEDGSPPPLHATPPLPPGP